MLETRQPDAMFDTLRNRLHQRFNGQLVLVELGCRIDKLTIFVRDRAADSGQRQIKVELDINDVKAAPDVTSYVLDEIGEAAGIGPVAPAPTKEPPYTVGMLRAVLKDKGIGDDVLVRVGFKHQGEVPMIRFVTSMHDRTFVLLEGDDVGT